MSIYGSIFILFYNTIFEKYYVYIVPLHVIMLLKNFSRKKFNKILIESYINIIDYIIIYMQGNNL